MIILHPNQIVRRDQRDQAVRELLVDAFIAAAELILILGKVDAIMEERPERAVGIAVVIFLDVLRLEVDRRGGEAIGARNSPLAGEMLDLLFRPADQDAAMLAQRAVHRDSEHAMRTGRAPALVDR